MVTPETPRQTPLDLATGVQNMSSLISPSHRTRPDGLFLERLEAFFDKSLTDIEAFSKREGRDFEETRTLVAESHCRYLFESLQNASAVQDAGDDQGRVGLQSKAYAILHAVSRALETLHSISGIQSFVLAVDPASGQQQQQSNNALDGSGFLGGTVAGREFWRGLRGGGEAGAKAFKACCLKETKDSFPGHGSQKQGSATLAVNAGTLKADLYNEMRSALRSASGSRTAEMKWSNHDRLMAYNVQIVGWPEDVPPRNPSSLSVSQIRTLLEALRHGSLRFVRVDQGHVVGGADKVVNLAEENLSGKEEDAFTWLFEDGGGGGSI